MDPDVSGIFVLSCYASNQTCDSMSIITLRCVIFVPEIFLSDQMSQTFDHLSVCTDIEGIGKGWKEGKEKGARRKVRTRGRRTNRGFRSIFDC